MTWLETLVLLLCCKTKSCSFTVGCHSAAGHTYGSGIAIFSVRSPFDNLYITQLRAGKSTYNKQLCKDAKAAA